MAIFKHFPEAKELFIDGTERRCQRPRAKKNQDRKYSGKSRSYSRKNIIISNKKKEILYLSPTKNGRKHDFNITKREELPKAIPPESDIYLDTGFQGIKNLVKNPDNIFMPRRNREEVISQEMKKKSITLHCKCRA